MSRDPFIGTKIGSYQITEAIGEGGMARIYKGLHSELNRYVAIKVVQWGLQEDPEFTDRFRREAQAIASLRHPNIVQIFDFGKHESGYYMIMEYIDGSDLARQLHEYRQNGELPPKEQVLEVMKDIAAALDYAHQHDVIHRDIKPSNIMINSEGQSILTDFGLVMLPDHKSHPTLGTTFGTPHYVAPEQAISSAAAVTSSDIYSLGVILFEMTTGQLPFDDESPLSVALKHVSDPPPQPTSINPDIPDGVEGVILKALSKEPTDRFATASQMAVALEEAWEGRSGGFKTQTHFDMTLPMHIPLPVSPDVTLTKPPTVPKKNNENNVPVLVMPPNWLPLVVAGSLGGLVVALALFVFANFYEPYSRKIPAEATENQTAFIAPTSTPSTTPTATNTSSPTPTTVPTSTATPTLLPTATATPLPPTPTDTSTPVSTPTLTETPTQTLTPYPTFTRAPSPTPTWSGPPSPKQFSGKILFKTDRSGTTEIYQMNGNGSDQRPIPREAWSLFSELEGRLSISSDSTRQVIPRGEGQLDLWLVHINTGGIDRRVTSMAGNDYDAAWSPVNNWISFVSEMTGRGDIYILNLDGSAMERVTVNTEDFDKHPTWSPDATKLAFWSDRGFRKNRQIWVVDLGTKIATSVSDNPFNDFDPVWVK